MTTRGLKAPARPPALLRACEQTTAATGVQHSKVYVRHFADGSGACCISNPNPKPNPNPDPDPKQERDFRQRAQRSVTSKLAAEGRKAQQTALRGLQDRLGAMEQLDFGVPPL